MSRFSKLEHFLPFSELYLRPFLRPRVGFLQKLLLFEKRFLSKNAFSYLKKELFLIADCVLFRKKHFHYRKHPEFLAPSPKVNTIAHAT